LANYVVLVCVCVCVRRMLLKSLQATYHALLPAFTTAFIGLRSVGRWVGGCARERTSGCRRLITAAIKPWLALWWCCNPRASHRLSPGLLQMKEARAPPSDRRRRCRGEKEFSDERLRFYLSSDQMPLAASLAN
jgi:hypothetical protein